MKEGPNRRVFTAGAAALAACAPHTTGAVAQELPSDAAWPRAQFPLRVDAMRLSDGAGAPFLLQGDTAWSLIAQLRREDAEFYLEDRRRRGFNAFLVSLIEHRYASDPPANAYAERPFRDDHDFSTTNDAYFTHAEWIVERAAEKGMLVLLAPNYLGYGGRGEGWYQEMVRNSRESLRAYGRYVGARFARFDNILWIMGADYNPPERWTVTEVAAGIREHDRRALMAAHCAPDTAALEFWAREGFLDVGTLYTYQPIARQAREHASLGRPFFLLETSYEGAPRDLNPRRQRAQAYHALLSGACGQVYGNVDVWHYDGPGLVERRLPWRTALDSEGAQGMTHLRRLFDTLPWWTLTPDASDDFLLDPPGEGQDAAVAARSNDLAVLYFPTPRTARVDLSRLRGASVAVRWFDPVTGAFGEETRLPPRSAEAFTTPPSGERPHDWVLIVRGTA